MSQFDQSPSPEPSEDFGSELCADDDDPIRPTFFTSKSTEDSSADGKSSEFAGDAEEPHGKAQSLVDEPNKAKTTRSWQRSGRARQREKARRRTRTPSPKGIA